MAKPLPITKFIAILNDNYVMSRGLIHPPNYTIRRARNRTDIGLTQKTSQIIPPCRASCFSCRRRARDKSLNRKGALASLRTLWFDFPLPVRKS
ncbi:hypothetical protein [Nostoc sp.]|uniref:hypothetical protein n=1 Tax=Nostoc sp. TaxID=1180 RepID=UPI002FF44127